MDAGRAACSRCCLRILRCELVPSGDVGYSRLRDHSLIPPSRPSSLEMIFTLGGRDSVIFLALPPPIYRRS